MAGLSDGNSLSVVCFIASYQKPIQAPEKHEIKLSACSITFPQSNGTWVAVRHSGTFAFICAGLAYVCTDKSLGCIIFIALIPMEKLNL